MFPLSSRFDIAHGDRRCRFVNSHARRDLQADCTIDVVGQRELGRRYGPILLDALGV